MKGVKRYKDKKKERYLSLDEMARLGKTLNDYEEEGRVYLPAINAIRLLLLTGCRKMEVLALTWDEVDFNLGCLRLKDSKTGQKIVPLGRPALELLFSMGQERSSLYVFPSAFSDSYFTGLQKVWEKKQAGLDDVRLHDLRYSFASIGAGAGLGLQVVGALLGHKDTQTTARYAHIADDPARNAANKISETIATALAKRDR